MRKSNKMRRLVLPNNKSNYKTVINKKYHVIHLPGGGVSAVREHPCRETMIKPQKRLVGASEPAGPTITGQQENISTLRTQQGHQLKWEIPARGRPASKKCGKNLSSYWLMKVRD